MQESKKVKNILIKISGDLINIEQSLEFIKKLSQTNHIVVVTGGGSQITEALQETGIAFDFGPAGRNTDFKGRQLSRDVLEKNQRLLQNDFLARGINATVEIPIVYIGGVLCPVNGDDFVIAAYNGFDEIYILTTQDRAKQKEEKFSKFPKIQIIGMEE